MFVKQKSRIGIMLVRYYQLKAKMKKAQNEIDNMNEAFKKHFEKYNEDEFSVVVNKEIITMQKQNKETMSFDYSKLKSILPNNIFDQIVKPSIDNTKLNDLIERGIIDLKKVKRYSSFKESIALRIYVKEVSSHIGE